MHKLLFLYSTVDGHTRGICERMAEALEARGLTPTIHELTPTSDIDVGDYDAVVIGASIRYGKHRPEVTKFINTNVAALQAMPAAFFSVNAVARKPEKKTPETNVYVRKFLKKIAWEPKLVGIFAGRIDYPSYGPFDRFMIRLIMRITKGPTDVSKSYEFTDWDDVAAFCNAFSAMLDSSAGEPASPGG